MRGIGRGERGGVLAADVSERGNAVTPIIYRPQTILYAGFHENFF
jgi:hypothetical protein